MRVPDLTDQELYRALRYFGAAGKTMRIKPETAWRLAEALKEQMARKSRPPGRYTSTETLTYKVETWSADGNHLYDLLSRSQGFDMAFAGYQWHVEHFPDRRLTLRQGVRPYREHIPENVKQIAAPEEE